MVNLIIKFGDFLIDHSIIFAGISGISILIPFAIYTYDSKRHPERYKEH